MDCQTSFEYKYFFFSDTVVGYKYYTIHCHNKLKLPPDENYCIHARVLITFTDYETKLWITFVIYVARCIGKENGISFTGIQS